MQRKGSKRAHQPHVVSQTDFASWPQVSRQARSIVLAARPHAVLWCGFAVTQHGETKFRRFAVVDGNEHLSPIHKWANSPQIAWMRAATYQLRTTIPATNDKSGPARPR